MRKVVFFDANMINPDNSYFLDEIIIKGKNLKSGDIVTAYQEGEEWDGIIIESNNAWGVELISEAKEVSLEKAIGYKEGFWEGYYCNIINLTKVLNQVNINQGDINFILEKMSTNLNKLV